MAEEPIRERILQHCLASLQAIDGTGPYHFALANVQRGRAVPDDLSKFPAAFLERGDEAVSQDVNLLLTRVLPITIEAWLDSITEELPTLAERLVADVERALMADPTRGGLADRTSLSGSSVVKDESPGIFAAVWVSFEIQYTTLRGDPANAG